ncbi:unnamed protein product [Cylindrotheca closterium]|uniref:PDZ domain-containing protein n=1 Tax=Cylindrotheca closterium TaxID=2856 RepID=A0AAD2CIT5_9STRA|nr:unnamed protein product [Cylindrotheca closterium]
MVVVKAAATKQAGAKYGIAFSRKTPDSPLMIRTIRDESPFAGKGLEPGMIVTKVNGEEMTWLGPRDAAKVLQKAQVGATMQVEAATLFKAAGKKPKRKTKCGIWLKNSTKVPGLFISQINGDSIFAGSSLETGMKVIQLNGTSCHDDMKFHEALELLKKASGQVEIVAADTPYKGKMKGASGGIPGLSPLSDSEDELDRKPLLDRLFPMLVDL